MWLLCTDGYLNVTQYPNDERVQIKSRDREDLVRVVARLRAAAGNRVTRMCENKVVSLDGGSTYEVDPFRLDLGGQTWKSRVIDTPNGDYKHRLIMPRAGLQVYLTLIGQAMEYTSFKQHMNAKLHESELPTEYVTMKLESMMEINNVFRHRWNAEEEGCYE